MDHKDVDLHVCDAADPHDLCGFITDWVTSWGYAMESTKHMQDCGRWGVANKRCLNPKQSCRKVVLDFIA
jgi:hypothetical protein